MKKTLSPHRLGGWALTPLLVFLLLYLVTSLLVNDFYKVPITVAFLVSSAYAVLMTPHLPLEERIERFSKGAAHPNILTMIWIFILAGAFAHAAKAMGAIDATVNLTLWMLPGRLLLGGLFLAACFISLSIGSSVGTIVALTPVAAGLAGSTGTSLPLMTAIVVGGAFFGDNLSFISDTTIAATRTQGCRMKDKFKVNFRIVMPAAFLVLLVYTWIGWELQAPRQLQPVHWIKILPYLLVLVTALRGWNVMGVLVLGILSCGIIGLLTGSFDGFGWMGAMGNGIAGMSDLILVTLLAGGMLELIRYNGGIEFIIRKLTRRINGQRGAELCIAALVGIANLCTANNTIAILTTGQIARDIARKYHVDPRRSASILDTFSCFVQGIIPYGAQLLIASGLASLSPLQVMGYLYYPFILGLVALSAIWFRWPGKYIHPAPPPAREE